MSKDVKKINSFFKTALKDDVLKLKDRIILSDRQEKIFDMFYIKRNDIGFISDTINCCSSVVNEELKTIRIKILKVI